jgi:hypothetical protein
MRNKIDIFCRISKYMITQRGQISKKGGLEQFYDIVYIYFLLITVDL